jgi:DNA ligase D-like protein (predicted ligase)
MKAVLTDAPFDDDAWVFERKLDGIRCLAVKDGDEVTMLTRNDLPLDSRHPEIAAALRRQPARSFAVDGELVAFEGDQTSFARLARRGREGVDVYLYVFDLLELDGRDVRDLPLLERKRLLAEALRFEDPIRLSEHLPGGGTALFERACREGWEGLIAKRADSPYVPKRSRDWLKIKCGLEQELVVGGYTEPRGTRTGFGALLLGHYRDGELVYAGKVGTGFDRALLGELTERLERLRRDDSPFAGDDAPRRGTTWVDPELVAQIGFSEWTGDGRLRHPRFVGLREDKAARDVVREEG